jgi:hypothetical protein
MLVRTPDQESVSLLLAGAFRTRLTPTTTSDNTRKGIGIPVLYTRAVFDYIIELLQPGYPPKEHIVSLVKIHQPTERGMVSPYGEVFSSQIRSEMLGEVHYRQELTFGGTICLLGCG